MNADLVEQTAKVMRIAAMVHKLLEELRRVPLDEAGRIRLAEIHRLSLSKLRQDGLPPELIDELARISLPFNDKSPTEAELRVAAARLVDWLEGMFHGIQTAHFAQQAAAQQQLQSMVEVGAAIARLREAGAAEDSLSSRADRRRLNR